MATSLWPHVRGLGPEEVFQTDPLMGCIVAAPSLSSPPSHRFLLTLEVGAWWVGLWPQLSSIKRPCDLVLWPLLDMDPTWSCCGGISRKVVFHQAAVFCVPSGSSADRAAACSEWWCLLFRSPRDLEKVQWETVDEDTTQAELCCWTSCCYGKLLSVPSLLHLCFNVGIHTCERSASNVGPRSFCVTVWKKQGSWVEIMRQHGPKNRCRVTIK